MEVLKLMSVNKMGYNLNEFYNEYLNNNRNKAIFISFFTPVRELYCASTYISVKASDVSSRGMPRYCMTHSSRAVCGYRTSDTDRLLRELENIADNALSLRYEKCLLVRILIIMYILL
jgi:hypothetical protein